MSSSVLNRGPLFLAAGACEGAGAGPPLARAPLFGLALKPGTPGPAGGIGAPGNRPIGEAGPGEGGRGSEGAGRGAAAGGAAAGAGRGGTGAGRGSAAGGVGAVMTVGLAGSTTAMACQTLPHFEQRTFRPVGGITAAVSKRVLQAGQIMTVIV